MDWNVAMQLEPLTWSNTPVNPTVNPKEQVELQQSPVEQNKLNPQTNPNLYKVEPIKDQRYAERGQELYQLKGPQGEEGPFVAKTKSDGYKVYDPAKGWQAIKDNPAAQSAMRNYTQQQESLKPNSGSLLDAKPADPKTIGENFEKAYGKEMNPAEGTAKAKELGAELLAKHAIASLDPKAIAEVVGKTADPSRLTAEDKTKIIEGTLQKDMKAGVEALADVGKDQAKVAELKAAGNKEAATKLQGEIEDRLAAADAITSDAAKDAANPAKAQMKIDEVRAFLASDKFKNIDTTNNPKLAATKKSLEEHAKLMESSLRANADKTKLNADNEYWANQSRMLQHKLETEASGRRWSGMAYHQFDKTHFRT